MPSEKVLSLFSGIGGFELAAELINQKLDKSLFETVALCDVDPFARSVLETHFEGIPLFGDVRSISVESFRLLNIPFPTGIVGGFPCQPFSVAGKKLGAEDERFLWGEFLRLIRIFSPQWFVFENVKGLLGIDNGEVFKRILWEISQCGYDAEWSIVPVAALGGTHRRERLFLFAYTSSNGRQSQLSPTKVESGESNSYQQPTVRPISREERLSVKSQFRRGDDGIPDRLDECLMMRSQLEQLLPFAADTQEISNRRKRLKALGNAICPQAGAIALNKILERNYGYSIYS